MKQTRSVAMHLGVLCASVLATGGTVAAVDGRVSQPHCQILRTGIGPVRLGMTLDDARRALPQASFRRSQGADDITVLEMWLGKEQVLLSEVGDSLPQGELPGSIRLKRLETYNRHCQDEKGVGPGTLLRDAVQQFGGLKEIVMSEQEQRQFVTFQNHPTGRWYRIDDSGIFTEGSPRHTTQFQPEARILGVGVDASPEP